MKNVIIDYRASTKTVDALKKSCYTIIKTPHLTTVYDTICGHPDIMLFKAKDGQVICEPSVFDYFSKILECADILKGCTSIYEKYPFDIAYNTALVGTNLFCNEKYTDKLIIEFANKNGIKIINTKQGYAKCSICIVSDNAIITADKNIVNLADKNNIDVLMIDDSTIKLDGFEHGFIGGATGLIETNILALNGNLNYLKDSNKIIDFCNRYNIVIKPLHNDEIVDIGSIIAI